ncbi:hypothetical protein FSP39_001627 [Pinctada imbricata]|uniref:Uncharacterized protein n=1 Tax=Pinctada imbricata TaxID=66713 RepID=A0AA88XHA4_PINIB|nr:hypothetical protein FSP39_001627 [Pinctada imbricata]
MAYGTDHEIDAIATLTAKIMPFLHPGLNYVEEGCARVSSARNPSFLVTSPDGTLRYDAFEEPVFMYENKCRAPNAFTAYSYYTIPHYYVPQLLCEMHAYQCKQLLFTCWSTQSTTAFSVRFDDDLWEECWTELIRVYEEKERPTRFSEKAKSLKERVKEFNKNNVDFIGEFLSCNAMKNSAEDGKSLDVGYYKSTLSKEKDIDNVLLSSLRDTLLLVQKWFDATYSVLRTVASEILVFMVNDLDRMHHVEFNNSHPIAYAMKGPNMTTSILRNMMNEIIKRCVEKGLNIAVTASDGQWHNYGVRDDDENPLTVHQLAKDFWATIRSKTKPQILSFFKKAYKITNVDEVNAKRIENGPLVVYGKKNEHPLFCRREIFRQTVNTDVSDTSSVGTDVSATHAVSCLEGDFLDGMDRETIEIIDETSFDIRSPSDLMQNQINFLQNELSLGQLFEESTMENTSMIQTEMSSNQCDGDIQSNRVTSKQSHLTEAFLSDDIYRVMLASLVDDEKAMAYRTWTNVTVQIFSQLFRSHESINKSFRKHELNICLKSVGDIFVKKGISVTSRSPKYKLVELFAFLHGLAEYDSTKSRSKPKKVQPISLHKLCSVELGNVPKDTLCVILAENEWRTTYDSWRSKNPATKVVKLENELVNVNWFSRPREDRDGKIRFHFTDACHILTCLRTKLCTTGIEGLDRKAWEEAALSKSTNLNISVVIDCVDKQDVSLARRMFDKDVQLFMEGTFDKEARFCEIVRSWFNAEDEPAISAIERCRQM